MQATVESYDAARRTGTVLLDDGVRLPFAAAGVAPEVRLLRSGQRVFVELAASGEQVAAVWLFYRRPDVRT